MDSIMIQPEYLYTISPPCNPGSSRIPVQIQYEHPRIPALASHRVTNIYPKETPGNAAQLVRVLLVCGSLETEAEVMRLPHHDLRVEQSGKSIGNGNQIPGESGGDVVSWNPSDARLHRSGSAQFGAGVVPVRPVASGKRSNLAANMIEGNLDGRLAVAEGHVPRGDGTLIDAAYRKPTGGESVKEGLRKRPRKVVEKETKKRGEEMTFMGVSKHKKSGRYEAHVWVPAYGKQVYLGGFGTPVAAAIAHDIVAVKVKKSLPATNFSQDLYDGYMSWIHSTKLPEIIAHIKRQSRSFTRGHSQFRGVSRNANGHWEARIGVGANRHLYLGAFKNEKTAARHYDRSLVRLKGESATPNFPVTQYQDEVKEHKEMKKALVEDPGSWDKQDLSWIKGGGGRGKLCK